MRGLRASLSDAGTKRQSDYFDGGRTGNDRGRYRPRGQPKTTAPLPLRRSWIIMGWERVLGRPVSLTVSGGVIISLSVTPGAGYTYPQLVTH